MLPSHDLLFKLLVLSSQLADLLPRLLPDLLQVVQHDLQLPIGHSGLAVRYDVELRSS